ncbi:MAG: YcjF family protein [Gemmobacter sp.]
MTSRPFVQDVDQAAVQSPADAPPVAEVDVAELPRVPTSVPRGGAAGRVLLWALGLLVSLAFGVWLTDFVTGLLARNAVLGGLALGLAALAGLTALVLVMREVAAFLRLGTIDALRTRAAAALVEGDLATARRVVGEVQALYSGRPDMAWARARLGEQGAEVLDAASLLDLAETELMAGPDRAARAEIEGAARRVAAATALIPLALADVAVAMVSNVAMIRRIAAIYGGRAGTFGSLRLLRRVFAHLVATGAVAVGDDLISSVAGGGVLSRVSRRFGEGVVNGALTARVGIAAMEVCRPLPFRALPRPRVTALLGRSLTGLFGDAGRG